MGNKLVVGDRVVYQGTAGGMTAWKATGELRRGIKPTSVHQTKWLVVTVGMMGCVVGEQDSLYGKGRWYLVQFDAHGDQWVFPLSRRRLHRTYPATPPGAGRA